MEISGNFKLTQTWQLPGGILSTLIKELGHFRIFNF